MLGRLAIVAWAVGALVMGSSLLAGHVVALPAPGAGTARALASLVSASPGEKPRWSVDAARADVARAGFHFAAVTPVELAQRYDVESAPRRPADLWPRRQQPRAARDLSFGPPVWAGDDLI